MSPDPKHNESVDDKDWKRLTPKSSPQTSSGYQSSQSSGDEAIDGNTDRNTGSDVHMRTEIEVGAKMEDISDWDYQEFDPENPYLYEELTYPPDQELHVPVEVSKLFYIPCKALPKRIQRKRITRSPEIKPKISKRTGRLKRSSQFLQFDSPSEGSDTD